MSDQFNMSSEDYSPVIEGEDQIQKKEEAERKYGCPCGKKYLSYPALFTHVKQKHDGKPPGQLIKPKTEKARGRPRLPTVNPDQDNSILNYDCQEQISKALMGKKIVYEGEFEFSTGKETCQDMASQFLSSFTLLEGEQKKILTCFINYIKFFIKSKYEEGYWETSRPTDIIDISNQIVRELEQHKKSYPLDKETLIELLFVLFRWMYKTKWTDHKLVKRGSEVDSNKENSNGK